MHVNVGSEVLSANIYLIIFNGESLSKLILWQKSRSDDIVQGKNNPIRMRVTKLCLSEFERRHASKEDLIFVSSQLMIVLISTDACEVCRMPEVWRRGLSPGCLNNL